MALGGRGARWVFPFCRGNAGEGLRLLLFTIVVEG